MNKHILFSLAAIILSFTNCVKPDEGGKDNPPAPQEQIVIPSTVDVKPVVLPEGVEGYDSAVRSAIIDTFNSNNCI